MDPNRQLRWHEVLLVLCIVAFGFAGMGIAISLGGNDKHSAGRAAMVAVAAAAGALCLAPLSFRRKMARQQTRPTRPAAIFGGMAGGMATIALIGGWAMGVTDASDLTAMAFIGVVLGLIFAGPVVLKLKLREVTVVQGPLSTPPDVQVSPERLEGKKVDVALPVATSQSAGPGEIVIDHRGFAQKPGQTTAEVIAHREWTVVCEACGRPYAAERRNTTRGGALGEGEAAQEAALQTAMAVVEKQLARPPVMACPECGHLQAEMQREVITRRVELLRRIGGMGGFVAVMMTVMIAIISAKITGDAPWGLLGLIAAGCIAVGGGLAALAPTLATLKAVPQQVRKPPQRARSIG